VIANGLDRRFRMRLLWMGWVNCELRAACGIVCHAVDDWKIICDRLVDGLAANESDHAFDQLAGKLKGKRRLRYR